MTGGSAATATEPGRRRRIEVRPRVVTAAILLFGLFLLAFSTCFPDLSWLLWGARVALNGGKFYRDFIEVNPPLILVLNVIPQAVAQTIGINPVLAYDAFIASLLALSLWMARRLYRGAELADQGPSWEWVLPSLLIGFVIIALSLRAWGQRDVIMSILVLPYAALAFERGEGRTPSRALIIAAALFGAIGIGIKPHFLIVLAAIEGYVASRIGIRRALLRTELVIVGATLTAYLVLSYLIWPEYFQFMRNLGGATAYAKFLPGRLHALTHFGSCYGALAILVSRLVPPRAARRSLWRLLEMLVAGFMLAAIAQQKGFDYHLLPTFVFGTALFLLALAEGGVRRPIAVIATAICMLVVLGKVASRTVRTAQMVVRSPGTHLTEVTDVIRQYAPHDAPVIAISLGAGPFFPAITNTGNRWSSAFLTVSPLLLAYADQENSVAPIRYHRPEEMGTLERYMYDRMISDIVARRPALIMLRRSLTDELFGDGRFNYLRYFSQDERFRQLMSGYAMLPIEDHYIYYAPLDVAARPPAKPLPRSRFATRWSTVCYNCLE